VEVRYPTQNHSKLCRSLWKHIQSYLLAVACFVETEIPVPFVLWSCSSALLSHCPVDGNGATPRARRGLYGKSGFERRSMRASAREGAARSRSDIIDIGSGHVIARSGSSQAIATSSVGS
jgi:hypothetical protein